MCNMKVLCTVCYTKEEARPCEEDIALNGTWFNQTCYNATYIRSFDDSEVATYCNTTDTGTLQCFNYTYNPLQEYLNNMTSQVVSASEEYFK